MHPDQPTRDEQQPTYGLPPDLVAHLRLLAGLPAPRLEEPAQWRVAVRDALEIARRGWATSALALGWTSLDLFGVGQRDSWDYSGLAVWLNGRTIVALDARLAVAVDGDTRECFLRGGFGHGKDAAEPPVHLWEFGRG
jgi:hypothetical protein